MKVLNKGIRSISHDEGVLLAGAGADLSAPVAEKILALYSDEVIVIEDAKVEEVVEAPKEDPAVEEPKKEKAKKGKDLEAK